MDVAIILLANGFFLSLILLVLLIILAFNGYSKPRKRKKVSEDLKKIKDQINGEEE